MHFFKACSIWDESLPVHGTPAETYLRRRGITCDLPKTLRFHPDCWHPAACRFPALVALAEGADRLAVHATYLTAEARTADVGPAKTMVEPVFGAAVRLSQAEGELVVAEGIETALSFASGLLPGSATIWAALSIPGMCGFRLPPVPGRLMVATDGNAVSRSAGRSLAERAASLGWAARWLPAPDGHSWNDILALKVPPHERAI